MGLIVSVYRNARGGDCTNGGVSSQFAELTVVNVSGPFEPADHRPAALLETGPGGDLRLFSAAQSADGTWLRTVVPGSCGPMFGGNYAATSDSRWSQATGGYGAIPIQDRWETPEQYAVLSS